MAIVNEEVDVVVYLSPDAPEVPDVPVPLPPPVPTKVAFFIVRTPLSPSHFINDSDTSLL